MPASPMFFISKGLLGVGCVLVLCVILTLGLWPFHSPANDVTWLGDRNGLSYEGEGTAFTNQPFVAGTSTDASSYSIELWAEPSNIHGGSTLLTFQQSGTCPQVSLRRSLSDLRIQTRLKKNYFDIPKRSLFAT